MSLMPWRMAIGGSEGATPPPAPSLNTASPLRGNRSALRSKLPEMVRQELWGILLTYSLIRYQMIKMAFSLKADYQ